MGRINNSDVMMDDFHKSRFGKDKTGITGYKEKIPANWKYKSSSATISRNTKIFGVVAVVMIFAVLVMAYVGSTGI